MRYYLININAVQNEHLDTLVASVVYAEQHSEDKTPDYIEKLEHLAKKIIPADLKRAFVKWFTISATGTMPTPKIKQIQNSLKEKDGNMLADLGERIYNEGVEKGREEGIERGIERGREEGRMEVAQNLLANGLDIAQVVRCTGLDWEAVTRLSKAD